MIKVLETESPKKIILNIVEWFVQEHDLDDVTIYLHPVKDLNCWGETEKIGDKEYRIKVCTEQSLRDTVATVMHEMVHVQQWYTNKWQGDGEKEAEKRQYKLADRYWKGK